MKKRLGLILAMAAMLCLVFTACGGPKNLEEYISGDEEATAQLEQLEEQNKGLTIDVSENTLTYTYDVSALGYSESIAKQAKSNLQKAIDDAGATYGSLAAQFEEGAKIEGVEIVVNYVYKDNVLATGKFTSADK